MGREAPVNEADSPALGVTKPPVGAGGERLPPVCGDFNMRIDRNGTWYYQGSPIGRLPLVKLFATVLRRDEDGVYWLTTPVENGRIEVEDAPFIALELLTEGLGRSRTVRFRTNVDDIVTLDPAHPLRVTFDPATGEPRPYVLVRGRLEARIARPVYYHLVEIAEPSPQDPATVGVWSHGAFFPLGVL
jgi:hypothetical protein